MNLEFRDLRENQVAQIIWQFNGSPLKFASDLARRKRSIRHKNWRPIYSWKLFAGFNFGVRKAAIAYPSQRTLPLRLTVTKLETMHAILAIIPNDQIEIIV